MTKARYRFFAAYNTWANDLVYEAATALPDAEYRADRGAFFKSMHGTLNHMVVADRVWMRRFTGSGPVQSRLDEILFETLPELRLARKAEDQRIIAYIAGLDEAALAGLFSYTTITDKKTIEQELSPALDHFFNHQTHHRGQIHCLLTMLTGSAPSLDMLHLQRSMGIGRSRIIG
jgi:uncharacterized damage-inducible protein DinB